MKLLDWVHRKFRQTSGAVFNGCRQCDSLSTKPDHVEHIRDKMVFGGLLTIGTMGSPPLTLNQETWTSPVTAEAIAERHAEELMVVGAVLEKPLLLETTSEAGMGVVSPLQGYLFGSAFVEAETRPGGRDRRASLGELLMLSIVEEREVENGGDAKSMAKKKLPRMKRIMLRGRGSGDNNADGNKYNKILKMFHKKVHPENSMATNKLPKRSYDYKNKENSAYDNNANNSDVGGFCGNKLATSGSSCRTERNPRIWSNSISGGSNNFKRSSEYWIRTDSDYLVLEL